MPSSKKPRKAYRPKTNRATVFIKKSTVQMLRGAFTHVQLLAETALPRGTLTPADLSSFRDIFNYVTVLFFAGNVVDLVTFETEDLLSEWRTANDALVAMAERCIDSKGKSTTAWAHEIKAIQAGLEIAGEVIDAELDIEPTWAYRVYMWTHHQAVENGVRFEVSAKSEQDAGEARRVFRRMIQNFNPEEYGKTLYREEQANDLDKLLKGELR